MFFLLDVTSCFLFKQALSKRVTALRAAPSVRFKRRSWPWLFQKCLFTCRGGVVGIYVLRALCNQPLKQFRLTRAMALLSQLKRDIMRHQAPRAVASA